MRIRDTRLNQLTVITTSGHIIDLIEIVGFIYDILHLICARVTQGFLRFKNNRGVIQPSCLHGVACAGGGEIDTVTRCLKSTPDEQPRTDLSLRKWYTSSPSGRDVEIIYGEWAYVIECTIGYTKIVPGYRSISKQTAVTANP